MSLSSSQAPKKVTSENGASTKDSRQMAKKKAQRRNCVLFDHNSRAPGFLKITCPVASCRNDLILVCPYCHEGALFIHPESGYLQCRRCRYSVEGVSCNCGFTIKPSYVAQKQQELQRMLWLTDEEAFKSIFGLFGAVIFGIMMFQYFL